MQNDITTGQQHILAPICQAWIAKIKDAKQRKWKDFGQYAVEGMKFYDGTHDWMWQEEKKNASGFLEKGAALPTFRMQVNRMFEAVALFGPALYHRNPDITVTSIDPPFIDPQMLGLSPEDPQSEQMYQQLVQQQEMASVGRKLRGGLKEHYLNWLQVETDKKTHARRSITEAIIKGMGILWTDITRPRGSSVQYPISHHISVDNIYLDPDAEYWEDVQYIARYCCHPVNLVEREYGLPPGSLKGHLQSSKQQGRLNATKGESVRQKRRGNTHDLIEYYKIYSKNGFGGRLKANNNINGLEGLDTEVFGDFCKIVVSEGIPYPLNMPTAVLSAETREQVIERAQWEIPYWTNGGWPFTRLSFYDKPRCVWPISLVKPAVGELRFVNWCMSFLADKTASACTTYVAQLKAAGVEIQDQIKNKMAPYTVLEISQITGRNINDVISFLEAPSFSVDIWRMLAEVMDMIDKRTGLTDLVYGMTHRQLRSATEADIKEQNTNIRPDDMASRVEDFLSETALNEMAACVWECEEQDVAPVLGPIGAKVFAEDIKTQEFERVIRDFDYRVAAGSARKPNKNSKQRALVELGQVILPTLQEFAGQGQVAPWNAYVSEVADAMDIEPEGFLLPEPEPQEGPSPEEQMMEMDMKAKELEMQIKQAEFQMKSQASEEELDRKQEGGDIELDIKQQEHLQDMRQDAQMHRQEMEQVREEAEQELLLKKAELSMMTKEQELKLEGIKKMQAAQLAAKKAQAAAAQRGGGNGESS